MLRFLFVSELSFVFLLSLWITSALSLYKIGIGIADVTGPATGVTFVSKSVYLRSINYINMYIHTHIFQT